jgi:hypothetical protein
MQNFGLYSMLKLQEKFQADENLFYCTKQEFVHYDAPGSGGCRSATSIRVSLLPFKVLNLENIRNFKYFKKKKKKKLSSVFFPLKLIY